LFIYFTCLCYTRSMESVKRESVKGKNVLVTGGASGIGRLNSGAGAGKHEGKRSFPFL
jgi:NADPH:quinone reductase-like Zn-dependent oxidoreductase